MGYNRSGARRKQKLRRLKKEERRLASRLTPAAGGPEKKPTPSREQ